MVNGKKLQEKICFQSGRTRKMVTMTTFTTTMINDILSNAVVPIDKNNKDMVARWRVPLHGKVYEIEFEHGTASGKRVLWIDKQEIFRRDWMFKLVGEDTFKLEDKRCIIRVSCLKIILKTSN